MNAMDDVEKKLKEAKLPEIHLEKHRRIFFKQLFATQPSASFGLAYMIRIREIVMVLLIVALTVINLADLGKPTITGEVAFAQIEQEFAELKEDTEESVAALRPDHLVIVPLYNNIAHRAGAWDILIGYQSETASFAVLPAGVPPYTWSVDNPSLMDLRATPLGFLVKGAPKRSGSTVLRVKDSTGLAGELKITMEPMPGPPATKESSL